MKIQIGIAAGKVLEFLERQGEVDLQGLFSGLDEPKDMILMGLGWLVREGLVVSEKEKTVYKVCLRKEKRQVAAKVLCPNFRQEKQGLCYSVYTGFMVPSIYELETYCLSGKYENCPNWQKEKT